MKLNCFPIDDSLTMDGATAAERICPWRRSSVAEGGRSSSPSPTNDPSSNGQTSSNVIDPNLHSTPLTSANYGGTGQKSSEYMGDYATTTKAEERAQRPPVWDLFTDQSRTPDEQQENKSESASDDSTTRL